LGGPLRWTEHDRNLALSYEREMRTVCPGCHTRKEEWEQNPDAYIGDYEVCPGCVRMEDERSNAEGEKGAHIRLLPQALALARLEELGNMPPVLDEEEG
jgi:predicted Fe-S protein YdhL (DUF1289 family)